MNNYEDRKLIPMPTPKPYNKMTDEELQKILHSNNNYNILIPALIESNMRKDKQIQLLEKRISVLENKALTKAGRKRQTFYLDGMELTDEDIIYYIDNELFTLYQLERTVGAKKNQLRNRYNRAKRLSVIQKNQPVN